MNLEQTIKQCNKDGSHMASYKSKLYCGLLIGEDYKLCKYASKPVQKEIEYIKCNRKS